VTNGPASQPFTLGIADDRSELPFVLFFPSWTGALLLDVNTASFLWDPQNPEYYLDANGAGQITVGVPANPSIIGLDYDLQWLGYDAISGSMISSHGVEVVVCP
jgi:hypothetical protein